MGVWGDFLRVAAVLPKVELKRRFGGTRGALAFARATGQRAALRDEIQRNRLRRAIAIVDGLLPFSEPNCFRRVLLEIALDRRAALEPVNVGLASSGVAGSGHVWLAGDPPPKRYDAVIVV